MAEIEYLELSEQILPILEKISFDYPSTIVKSNGQIIVLQFVDFFNVHMKRTAFSIIANTCAALTRTATKEADLIQIIEIIVNHISDTDERVMVLASIALRKIASHCLGQEIDLLKPHFGPIIAKLSSAIASDRVKTESAVFWNVFKCIFTISSASRQFANILIKEHNLLRLLESFLLGKSGISNFAVSKSLEQVQDFVRLLCELLPVIPLDDSIWRVKSAEDPVYGPFEYPDLDVLLSYQQICLPLLFEMSMTTFSSSISLKILECISKCIYFAFKYDALSDQMLLGISFTRYTFQIIANHERLPSCKSTHELSQILSLLFHILVVIKLVIGTDSKFGQLFYDQGCSLEIDRLVETIHNLKVEKDQEMLSASGESDQETASSKDDSVITPRNLKSSNIEHLFGIFSKSTCHSSKSSFRCFSGEPVSEQEAVSMICCLSRDIQAALKSHTTSDSIFNEIAERLDITADLKNLQSTLTNAAGVFIQSNVVSRWFEIFSSGFSTALHEYLTADDRWIVSKYCRRKLFIQEFASHPGAFELLVKSLCEYVSRSQRFKIAFSYHSGFFSAQNLFQLKRKLSLKVEPLIVDQYPEYRKLEISVLATSNVQDLNAYVVEELSKLVKRADDTNAPLGNESLEPFDFFWNDVKLNPKDSLLKSLVVFSADGSNNISSLWTSKHIIKYAKNNSASGTIRAKETAADFLSIEVCMQLLKELFHLNRLAVAKWQKISLDSFFITTISAKVKRQSEETLLLLTNAVPTWFTRVVLEFPFVIPFLTRYKLMDLYGFGNDNRVMRYINLIDAVDAEPQSSSPKPSKNRITVDRTKLLSILDTIADQSQRESILEVEFENECGTGLGPTVEFFSLVAVEIKNMPIWNRNSDQLFPHPLAGEAAMFFKIGCFIAKSILDSRILGIEFSPLFWRLVFQDRMDYDNDCILNVIKVNLGNRSQNGVLAEKNT
jgi:E3 ubiquitin-protein ligase TRIP12